jgi:Mg2+/Co2+ transporter CorB
MHTTLLSVISIVLSIIFAAFFAGAETAITGASTSRIHKLKVEGNKKAIMVSKLREDKERLISALLLGNCALNTISSALSTSLAIAFFGYEGVLYVTALTATILIVFAEVLPKTYAFDNAEKVALWSAPLLTILLKILLPITSFIQMIVKLFLNITGMDSHRTASTNLASDDIREAIELHHHEGSFVKDDKDMLGSILDLGNTEVEEIMVHRKYMKSINIDLPTSEIIQQLLDATHTRIPVWQGDPDNIIGLINTKDILKLVHLNGGQLDKISLKDIISEPWFIPETTTLKEQLFEFRKRRNHVALVVDEYGALMGLVTLEDILEEIVGQIDDEHDHVKENITVLDDGAYIADGKLTIRDFNRQFEWNLPDHHANTIAGLIIHESQKIPEEGESFVFYGVQFDILQKTQNEVVLVKLTKLE